MPQSKLGELPEGVASAMYLRDGWPVVVCKAVMNDGRVGIGIIRPLYKQNRRSPAEADAAALAHALEFMSDTPPDYSELRVHMAAMAALAKPKEPEEVDDDLQASLGQKAHE